MAMPTFSKSESGYLSANKFDRVGKWEAYSTTYGTRISKQGSDTFIVFGNGTAGTLGVKNNITDAVGFCRTAAAKPKAVSRVVAPAAAAPRHSKPPASALSPVVASGRQLVYRPAALGGYSRPTWFATINNGYDLRLSITKAAIEAEVLTRSGSDVKIIRTFLFPVKIKSASGFDPNNPGYGRAALQDSIEAWAITFAGGQSVAPAPAPAKTSPIAPQVPASAPSVALPVDPHTGTGVIDTDKLAWQLIRDGKPKLNFTVLETDVNDKPTKIRIHSIDITVQ